MKKYVVKEYENGELSRIKEYDGARAVQFIIWDYARDRKDLEINQVEKSSGLVDLVVEFEDDDKTRIRRIYENIPISSDGVVDGTKMLVK